MLLATVKQHFERERENLGGGVGDGIAATGVGHCVWRWAKYDQRIWLLDNL